MNKTGSCNVCDDQDSKVFIFSCNHNLCADCFFRAFFKTHLSVIQSIIQDHSATIQCTTCNKGFYTTSPQDLEKFLSSLVNVTMNSKSLFVQCSKHSKIADTYCENCIRWYCPDCIQIHLELGNSHHKVTKESFQPISIIKCKLHESKMKFYCCSCNKLICSSCFSLTHKDHKIQHANDYLVQLRDAIQSHNTVDFHKIFSRLNENDKEFQKLFVKNCENVQKKIEDGIKKFEQWKEMFTNKMKEVMALHKSISQIISHSYTKIYLDLQSISECNDIYHLLFLNEIEHSNITNDFEFKFDEADVDPAMETRFYNFDEKATAKLSHNINPGIQLHFSNSFSEITFTPRYEFHCIHTLTGHCASVRCVLLLQDGRIASGSCKEIKIWDPKEDFKCTYTLTGHNCYVTSLVLLPDGKMASSGEDESIEIWDPKESFKCIKSMKGLIDNANSLILLENGNIASISDDCSIKIRSPSKGFECEYILKGHTDWINAMLLLSDGKFASGSCDATIRIWDPQRNYACAYTLTEHTGRVNSLILLNDMRMASCSDDFTIKIWKPKENFKCEQTLFGHTDWVLSLLPMKDGRIVSISSDKSLKVWKEYN